MGSLNVFTFGPTPVRVVFSQSGDPLWVAKDVAEALGYVWNGTSRIEHVPAEWRGVTSVVTPSGAQDMAVLSEQGLYYFLARSDKPAALPFQKWVAGDVLPSIRRTGSYSLPAQVPQTLSEALRLAADLEDQRAALAAQAVVDAPKVQFAMAVKNADDALAVGKFAKLLGAGEIRFYRWLRERGILFRNGRENVPMQRYLDLGYFRVIENVIWMGDEKGNVPTVQPLITGKGQIWLEKKWREDHPTSAQVSAPSLL